jgi:hypothetical protein
MGLELTELLEESRTARSTLDQGDARTNQRIDQIEKSVNELFRKVARPPAFGATATTTILNARTRALRHQAQSDGP